MTNNSGLTTYTFSQNGSFTFDFIDAAGNTGSATATVNNIDKSVPTATISYSTTSPTNQDVIATLQPSETVTVTNNSGLTTYTFSQNGSFTFDFIDAAGNTGSATATVNNIDKSVPTATISYSTTSPTNQDVIATLQPSETVTVTNNSGLTTYTFSQNGSFTFDFIDAAGNTGSATATVNNIDKSVPTATISYSTTSPTNQDVIATLQPSETVTVTNNSGLTTYTFSQNGSFTFDFIDAAGNTGSATATVNNIDKSAPQVVITDPPDGDYLYPAQQTIRWTISEGNLASVVFDLNGSSQTMGLGMTETTITLNSGVNSITISATDQAANFGSAAIKVTLDGDNDGDGVGDYYDLDDDNDLMPDSWELTNGLDPFDPLDAYRDSDGDGYANLTEYTGGTNPLDLNSYPILTLGVDHITITDVTPSEFSVIWQSTEASTCSLVVYNETGALLSNVSITSESASHAPAEDIGVMKVTVTGLDPNKTYHFQTITTSKEEGLILVTPPGPQLIEVVTESASSLVDNDPVKQMIYDEDGNNADGALLVASVQGGNYPVTAWVGQDIPSPWARLNLNRVYSSLAHDNLPLLGGEELTLWSFGGQLGNYANLQNTPIQTGEEHPALTEAAHLSKDLGYHLDLEIDLNIFGLPVHANDSFTAYSLLLYLKEQGGGDASVVKSIRRYNTQTGSWETASWFMGSPAGVDFPIKVGEANLIYMSQDMDGVWFEGTACGAAKDLTVGLNLVSLPVAEDGHTYTSYQMLEDLGDESHVSSIRRYNSTWETTSWFAGSPSGAYYSTSRGEGYLLYMKQAREQWRAY